MSEGIVEYSVTWWVLMCSLGLAAVSVGALLISVVIPMLGSAIKELVRMFGRKKMSEADQFREAEHERKTALYREYKRFSDMSDRYLEEKGITKLYMPKSDLVTCERCKCLLRRCDAYRGESVIEEYMDGVVYSVGNPFGGIKTGERIRERYYCAVHKPKGKK